MMHVQKVTLVLVLGLGLVRWANGVDLQVSSGPLIIGESVTMSTEGGIPSDFYWLFADNVSGDFHFHNGAWFGLGFSPGFVLVDQDKFGSTGRLDFVMQVPDDPRLVGLSVFVQGVMDDPPIGVATSNRLDLLIRERSRGILISVDEILTLPKSGTAWDQVLKVANETTGTPDLSDQDDFVNVRVLAKALVFGRTGDQRYRSDVIQACMDAIGTEQGGRTLALGRELAAYVISADIVGLPSTEDQRFRDWLRDSLDTVLDGKTLRSTHEERPNNWGTHCGGSRAAIAAYLGDSKELARCAQVLKGWLGDRSSYAGFEYGDLSWQADPSHPVGINSKGSTKQAHSIDGVLPDDQRRGGGFQWPPPKENYVYEALQGALLQAIILDRNGYDTWNWEDRALLRAFNWLHKEADFDAEGDDDWQPHVVNFFYGTAFPAPEASNPGKNIGWTCWIYGRGQG